MSKNLKTTQLKTKSRISTETTAKKSTTSGATAVTTKTKSTKTAGAAAAAALTTKSSTTKVKDNEDKTNKSRILTKTSSTDAARTRITATTTTPSTKARTQTTVRTAATTKTLTTTKPKATTALPKTAAAPKRVATHATKNVAAKTSDKSQPVRAKHSAAIVEAVKKNTANVAAIKSPAKPNAVLDTYHNVTVVSPPSKRKELPQEVVVEVEKRGKQNETKQNETKENETESSNDLSDKGRPSTGTLEADEVIVLKSASAKRRSERVIQQEAEAKQLQLKEPVAFEVNFEDKLKPTKEPARERSRSRVKELDTKNVDVKDNEIAEYSDDFESYESDFETGSSTRNGSTVDSESGSSESISEDESTTTESESDADIAPVESGKYDSELLEEHGTDEESELTQFPVTVIQRDKDRERKLDSGNYEMNSRRQVKLNEMSLQTSQQVFDSLDTFSAGASEQLDSGISSYGNTNQATDDSRSGEVFYGGYADFNTRPRLTKRGLELMSKIQFDTLSFTLLDLKPICYDVFMQTFGKLNTTQSSTQTKDNHVTMECQTDDCDVRSIWTQHPPQYDLQTVQRLGNGLGGGSTVQNCCGELPLDEHHSDNAPPRDEFEASLQALSVFRESEGCRTVRQQLRRLRKPIDIERLNVFLLNSSMLMSRVLNANNSQNQQQLNQSAGASPLSAISAGYRQLDTHILNALRVVRIFANAKFNLVITVHESLPDADVYRSDFSNLLMVWSTSDSAKPIRLLSTWSQVCRVEICHESADIIVCGLRDGSVAMWDLRETYSFCSKLDGHLTHFAATQSIVPTCGDDGARKLMDLGAVVDVKSFRSAPKSIGLANAVSGYKSIQFTSLNDTGVLTVWTLVETSNKPDNFTTRTYSARRPPPAGSKFEYSSPWARVKLIQSAICDLRDYLERGIMKAQSKFDQTKSLFQKNIYSDEVLRELNETQSELKQGQGLQGLRFTSIDTGCERIYVCTNRNFILACSKSLKSERFRKITINESRFLFPTALRVLTNEYFLAVGLSNGSVMILNCNQNHSALLVQNVTDEQQNQPPPTASSQSVLDYEIEMGKSCAIQNIILNERRSFENNDTMDFSPNYELRPSTTAACIAMINEQKKPFELRVYDQQILLSGSVLRKHLVQSLELSSDGWKLFALSNGEVRTYDFYLDRELEGNVTQNSAQKVIDIAVARNGTTEQHLLVLHENSDVHVHLLKQ